MKRAKCGCLYDGCVQFCPLHAQAEGMREALQGLLDALDAMNASNHPGLKQDVDEARAILRATEGRGTP